MKTNLSIVTLATLLAFASCKSDTLQSDLPKPGEPNDSINVFNRVKVSWAPTDYQEVEYDASKTPIRYTLQNLYNQGTGQVLKVVYNFIYTGKQLTRLEASNGSSTTSIKYTYTGDQVSRTEEFSANGKLVNTITYQYFPNNRLRRLDKIQGEGAQKLETIQTFTYDDTGNLTQLVDATKDAQTGAYKVELVTRYTGHDSHKNVSDIWTVYPFLPNVTFQVNNPAAITQYIEGPDGAETLFHRSEYTYRYSDQGYPISHTKADAGGTQIATYTYVSMK